MFVLQPFNVKSVLISRRSHPLSGSFACAAPCVCAAGGQRNTLPARQEQHARARATDTRGPLCGRATSRLRAQCNACIRRCRACKCDRLKRQKAQRRWGVQRSLARPLRSLTTQQAGPVAWVHGLVKPLSVSLGHPSSQHSHCPSVPPRLRALLLPVDWRRCGSERPNTVPLACISSKRLALAARPAVPCAWKPA
jgi:hypothetical protein